MNILITGGSSEIAQAIAKKRIEQGDNITITCSSEESLADTLRCYREQNLSVNGIVYNFDQPEKSTHCIENISKPIDAVILNAFTRVEKIRKLHDLPYQIIQEYINRNLQGNIWLIHYLLPHMLGNQFGRFVFISSLSSISGTSRYGAYCAAKAAMEGLFLNLAVEYSSNNILSNIIRVGIIKTQRNERFWKRASYQQKMSKIIPQGFIGKPAQVAEVIDPLLSPTSFVTGSIVTVSGGLPLLSSEGLLT